MLRFEVSIDAPADVVWGALRDPQEVRRWHGWEYDDLEAEIEAIYFSGAVACEADRTLDTGGPPDGPGKAVVTTYGMDDASFEALVATLRGSR